MIAFVSIAVISLFDRTNSSVHAARVDHMPVMDTILPDSIVIRNIPEKPKPRIQMVEFCGMYGAPIPGRPASESISDLDW